MARYIDADKAFEAFTDWAGQSGTKGDYRAYWRCAKFLQSMPTADVVPKSEYDNLKSQFEALDHECDRLERAESNRHDAIEQAKSEVAKIFEEIENLFAVENFRLICNRQAFAELKKKYTGGDNNVC